MGFTVVAVAFALALALLLVASARGGGRRARRTRLAQARDGQTLEFRGVVRRGGAALRAPIGGNPCCAYMVAVRRQGDEGWVVVHQASRAEPLVVDDSTARAVLQASSLSIDGVHTERFSVPSGELSAELAAYERAHGLSFEPGMVVTQAIVLEGDEVRVTGCARREVGAAVGNYREPAEGWVIREPPSASLSITVVGAGRGLRGAA
jgi:hypothetical protein